MHSIDWLAKNKDSLLESDRRKGDTPAEQTAPKKWQTGNHQTGGEGCQRDVPTRAHRLRNPRADGYLFRPLLVDLFVECEGKECSH